MKGSIPTTGVCITSPGDGPANPKITTSAEALAASVVLSYMGDVGLVPQSVYEELKKRTDVAHSGNLEVAERMLMSQALMLQSVATNLFLRASNTKDIKVLQPIMQLALKAQSNCRVTLETLNEFKNPRSVAFVRQTNVANVSQGPQQVNFSAEPGRALKRARGKSQTGIKTNELLEGSNGTTHLDTRTAPAAAGSDRALEAVGAINRPAKPRRKAEKLPKRNGSRSTLEPVA